MSDLQARRDIIVEIETTPGTVGIEADDPRKFPFEAFEFEEPSGTSPELIVKSPWRFRSGTGSYLNFDEEVAFSSLALTDVFPVYDTSVGVYRKVTLQTLKTFFGL
jgi:hypothetical protein